MKENLQRLGTVVATLGGMLFSCRGVELLAMKPSLRR